jgi:hypothetical protein
MAGLSKWKAITGKSGCISRGRIDQNLSPKLVQIFNDCRHLQDLGFYKAVIFNVEK